MRPACLPATVAVWLALPMLLAGGTARAEEPPPRLYLRTGLAVGYSHYWQINYADRDVGGATVEIPLTLAARLRPWLAIGGAFAAHLHPAHAGSKATGAPVTVAPAGGGYVGLSIVLLAPRVVTGEIVVGLGGGGNPHWGGGGLVLAPSLSFDVLSRGHSHLAVDVKALYGQWTASDNVAAVRVFVGLLAGITYSIH